MLIAFPVLEIFQFLIFAERAFERAKRAKASGASFRKICLREAGKFGCIYLIRSKRVNQVGRWPEGGKVRQRAEKSVRLVRAEKSVRFVGSLGRLLDRRAPLNREASVDLGTANLQGSTFAFRSTDAFRFKGALRSTNNAHLVGAQNINKDGARTRVYIWLCWSFTACVSCMESHFLHLMTLLLAQCIL